ncbi:hypothetical protein [Falsiroseomonas ponticola]|uniref:hypothetical protein n=1 Tax=Falsiroseomonas ponticola TaxID=2786951 RepID=UPI001931A3DC|nr:hypothetical protein [Roseomonas ponticola]
MRRLALSLLLLAGLAPPAPAQTPAEAPFSFAAFGDMPYCLPTAPQDCPAEHGRVARLVQQINATRPAFTLYVGDTKGGSEVCTDDTVLRAFSFFGLATHPLIYTPGDNEWTDCWQDRAGRFDPLERLALLRARFFADDRSLGRQRLPLLRQADADPAHRLYVENARWQHGAVTFVTLHVPGSNNNRPTEPGEGGTIVPPAGAMEEYQARNAANLAWLSAAFAEAARRGSSAVVIAIQADLFYAQRCGRGWDSGYRDTRDAIGREAAAFGKPVLLINGDSHFWLHDRPIASAPNLTRIMVPGEQDIRAVRIEVDPAAADPWRFSLIGAEDRPARPGC